MRFPRLVLWLMASGFMGFGLAYSLWPVPMARLTEIRLLTATARIDFTATYGGLQLGFGIFLLQCARRSAWLAVGLWAATVALLGVGGVRLLGLFFAPGPPAGVIYAGVGIELGGAALSLWSAWQTGSQTQGRLSSS